MIWKYSRQISCYEPLLSALRIYEYISYAIYLCKTERIKNLNFTPRSAVSDQGLHCLHTG